MMSTMRENLTAAKQETRRVQSVAEFRPRFDTRLRQDEALAAAAQARLQRSPYHVMRQVACQCQHGVLILTGRVPSYYHKQHAEELTAGLPGMRDISNQLQVITPPQWDLVPPQERRADRRRSVQG